MDVKKLLFLFENVITKGLKTEQKTKEILLYLEGEAFDFYCDKFASGDPLSEEAKDYRKVKAALLERFFGFKRRRDCHKRCSGGLACWHQYHGLPGKSRYPIPGSRFYRRRKVWSIAEGNLK
jgi:hypothetical protein